MEAILLNLQYIVNWRTRQDSDVNILCNLFLLVVQSVTCLLFNFQVVASSCSVDSETSLACYDSSIMME